MNTETKNSWTCKTFHIFDQSNEKLTWAGLEGFNKIEGKKIFLGSLFVCILNFAGAGKMLIIPLLLVSEFVVGAKIGSRYGAW